MVVRIFNLLKSKKQTSLLFFGNVAITLTSFFCIIILSHLLSIADYGFLREVYLYTGLLVVIGSSGFAQAIYYYLHKADKKLKPLVVISQTRYLILGFLAISFLIFLSLRSFIAYQINLAESISVVFYTFALGFTAIDLNLAITYKKTKAYFISNVGLQILKLFFFYYLAVEGADVVAYLIVSCIFQWLILAANFLNLGKVYLGALNKGFDQTVAKAILKYASPLALSAFVGFLMYNTDKILFSFLKMGGKEFAILSNVAFEIPFLGSIYMSFFTIALPLLINNYEKNEISLLLKNRFNYIYSVARMVLPIVIGVILWNKNFMELVFGEFYTPYAYLFATYTIISLLRFCSHHDILLATNHTRMIMYFQIAELIFHVILSIILFQFFQIKGLIAASVISNYLYMFLVNLVSSFILKVNFLKVVPFRFLLLRIFFLGISAYIIKFMVENLLPKSFWWIALLIWLMSVIAYEIKNLRLNDG